MFGSRSNNACYMVAEQCPVFRFLVFFLAHSPMAVNMEPHTRSGTRSTPTRLTSLSLSCMMRQSSEEGSSSRAAKVLKDGVARVVVPAAQKAKRGATERDG